MAKTDKSKAAKAGASKTKKQGVSNARQPRAEDPQAAALAEAYLHNRKYALAKDEYSATARDNFNSLALAVRDRLIERWMTTQQSYYQNDSKRVYYLSLEFLMGRTLGNALLNLGLTASAHTALHKLGCRLEDLEGLEHDAGLGNGGLGRLAACLMDSMATLGVPAYGYGLRYEYGIFFQRLRGGRQEETPDNWLRHGNPWEIERPEHLYPVHFYGRVDQKTNEKGQPEFDWVNTETVMAMAYDTPIPGYRNNTVNNLRLWSAKSTREFDLDYFNHGDYERAVADKDKSETITKVLYPNDNVFEGRELRLKQEYFLVSATLQDIVRRYQKGGRHGFAELPTRVAIQLNDTHPSVAILELMRILMDHGGLGWDEAWDITVKTVGYTNHTVLPEALEKWPLDLFSRVLPRHAQILLEVNRRLLEKVSTRWPGDSERLRRMSLIEEGGEKRVLMSHLSIAGSHSVNGVSALHTDILKNGLFADFFELWPERFNNKTNGISQRRWLMLCNPGLAELLDEWIGHGWDTDLEWLRKLAPLAEEESFRRRWRAVKLRNKKELAVVIQRLTGVFVDPGSLFDCQVKRIHEYKRQLLNALHVLHVYLQLRADPGADVVPRTVIFAGKAAPGYAMAKLIIRLILAVAARVNADPSGKLRVVFLPNYGVSLAERIIPAAELSEQISLAGTEASGTGNMKLSLNGALTIGTLDGANVEIRSEVGAENFFLFGLTASQVAEKKLAGYDPRLIHASDPRLSRIIELLWNGSLSPDEPDAFKPIARSLLDGGDEYMLLADFDSYVACQEEVASAYKNQEAWTRMSILNVARMGKFSSDRTVREYRDEIWGLNHPA
ncbi:MAG: glycogen/starch/alpha-glucan phosphorylase [Spirochaetia bacterium]